MTDPIKFFTDRFNLTFAEIESLLAAALSQGGDYAAVNNPSLVPYIRPATLRVDRLRPAASGAGIALTAAARAYVNPTGAKSRTKVAGPFTETVSYGAAQVGVYLTDGEIARLKGILTRGVTLAGTIRLRSGYPPIC